MNRSFLHVLAGFLSILSISMALLIISRVYETGEQKTQNTATIIEWFRLTK